MQNFAYGPDRRSRNAFVTKIEDIPGGITLATNDLPAGSPSGNYYVPEGAIVGLDPATGLWRLLKTAVAQAAANSTATAYQVNKGHAFKVGDFIGLGTGGKAVTITAIDKTNADYDVITVDATIGSAVTVGQAFSAAAAAASNNSVLPYTQYAAINNDVELKTGDNHLVGAWKRATIKINVAPAVPTSIKTSLANGSLGALILYV
jgi:hypothetical protein